MSKKVLILAGSPRKGGNSDLLCDEFLKGALNAGNSGEKIFIQAKKIAPCMGCYYCQKNGGVCAINDDMKEIIEKVFEADVIVLSSPVYFYSISAQLKAVIDRLVARWTEIKNKDFYYIMTSAEDSPTVMDCTLECFRGLALCLDGSKEKGIIFGKGVYEKGEIKDTPYLKQAYEMGKKV